MEPGLLPRQGLTPAPASRQGLEAATKVFEKLKPQCADSGASYQAPARFFDRWWEPVAIPSVRGRGFPLKPRVPSHPVQKLLRCFFCLVVGFPYLTQLKVSHFERGI